MTVNPPISPVYSCGPSDPPTGEEARRRTGNACRTAWQRYGLAVINPDEVLDDWERQVVINIASKLYGERDNG